MRRTRSQSVGACLLAIGLVNVKKKLLVAGATLALVAGMASTLPSAYAGGTIKADEDKWISVGMGIRMSFNGVEYGAADRTSYSNQFVLNNTRIYINGKIHKYVGFTFNTECFNCQPTSPFSIGQSPGNVATGGTGFFGGNSTVGMLDAIGKFEITETVNFWVGRTLVPFDRGELNGPFYHATFEGFKTPFYPADFSGNIGSGGAGLFGRDDGVVFFGKVHPGGTHLQYVASVFTGLQSPTNPGSSLSYAGRLQWNLLNDEDNPGYYTSGTYYGTAGDILAFALAGQHQKDGAGSALNRSDFTGLTADVLYEKVLPDNMGVFTFNGEFKRMWAQNAAAFLDAACFCTFSGHSWTVYGLYLLPNEVGIGKFQPYARFTSISPQDSINRQEWEGGVNYVIAGHNARISAFYQYGDLTTTGLNYAPGVAGNKADAFKVALQLQY